MKTKKQKVCNAVLAAMTSAGILAVFHAQVSAQSSQPNLNDPGSIRWTKGRILVQPRAGLALQELDKKLKAHGGRRVGQIQQINVHIVELPAQASERAVAQMLNADAHIKFAELDQQMPAALTPNDPSYGTAWHLPKIGAPEAWNHATGDGVTIAILDTGVDGAHPDLVPNLVAGYNVYDNNSDTRDVHGHGTKTAGAAAMAGNNLIGGAGVSFKSKIMPVRVADANAYAYYSTMAKGVTWAADHGAKVANMSYWGVCSSATILSAVQYLRNKGGVAVGSAGNSGGEVAWGANDAITCVAATDGSDSKASFSSFGEFVDVAAPGVGIYTTTRGGGYGSVSGTSFSSPVTAAVYALMMSANRSLSPGQLDTALFSTARDLGATGKDAYFGHGRVDAAAAVAKVVSTSSADTAQPSVSFDSLAGSTVSGLVTVDVSASDNVGVSRVELYAGSSRVGSDSAAPYAFSWDTSALAGQVTLEARAYDAAGNMGSANVTVTVGVADDAIAPVVTITNPTSGSVISGATTISASASDNKKIAKLILTINGKEVASTYGSALSYSWDPYSGGKTKGRGRNKNTAAGSYSIGATATDAAGNTKATAVSVTVQ